jgi:hypothetical protein
MKKVLMFLAAFISVTAFANDVSYVCKNANAVDVSLPSSIYVQIEGYSVSIQDNSNDIYHTGKLTNLSEGANQVAVGFKSLILADNGRVLISQAMLNQNKQATLTIVDDALDSTSNEYQCLIQE